MPTIHQYHLVISHLKMRQPGDAHWRDAGDGPSETSVNSGLVIQNKDGDEYVWIPVPDVSELGWKFTGTGWGISFSLSGGPDLFDITNPTNGTGTTGGDLPREPYVYRSSQGAERESRRVWAR